MFIKNLYTPTFDRAVDLIQWISITMTTSIDEVK